jgi:DASS family divalent anion:Na+ symporter
MAAATNTELQGVRWKHLLLVVLVGVAIWLIPAPTGVDRRAWQLLAIFVATIVGLIVEPLPLGAVALSGITATAVTGTLSIDAALSGFGNRVIWLIVIAFFISRGFIKTGLGARIAYLFVAAMGKRSLGLAYGLIATDLVLSPAIPSNTARAGAVIFPIVRSIAQSYGSEPNDGTARKIGAFLIKASFQGNVVTSAMFLTAMAANPLAAALAKDAGVDITWGLWALAALVPGLISLIVIPWLLYVLYPPAITETPSAPQLARDQMQRMGKVKRSEWIMLLTFILLLALWIFGDRIALESTTAAFIGLVVLLVTGTLSWEDILQEKGAWNTLVWFSALVMMATYLNNLGLIPWFGKTVSGAVGGYGWVTAFLIISLSYFYSHYFFASNTAHVSSMYAAFLAVAVAAGTPPLLAALVLGFFSNLFSSMTHYGAGPAPVLFGSGYVEMAAWWKLGALFSVVNIVIWLGIGGLWWKVIGVW